MIYGELNPEDVVSGDRLNRAIANMQEEWPITVVCRKTDEPKYSKRLGEKAKYVFVGEDPNLTDVMLAIFINDLPEETEIDLLEEIDKYLRRKGIEV